MYMTDIKFVNVTLNANSWVMKHRPLYINIEVLSNSKPSLTVYILACDLIGVKMTNFLTMS